MQTDHRVPTTNTTAMRQQQYRKRSFSGVNPRKRDRHDLICVVCHAPAMGKKKCYFISNFFIFYFLRL